MRPKFVLTLTRHLRRVPRGLRRLHAPEGRFDPVKGLEFPLNSGGLAFASEGIIDDAAGTIEIFFTPKTSAPNGALIQAWGQYDPLLALSPSTLELMVYGTRISILVRWTAMAEHLIRLSWDHRWGIVLSVRAPHPSEKQSEQIIRRRISWKAFRQKFVPFSIGGLASEPRYRKWSGSFEGWIRSVKLWPAPLDPPGPILEEIGPRAKEENFAANGLSIESTSLPKDVKLLESDAPPIIPDPLHLDQLPDRLRDLQKTREVCRLDEVVAKAKSEIEIFAALTHWVAHLWPHCNYWPWPPGVQRDIFWRRGHEIIPEVLAGRMGGMCGGFAHTMEEVFWAMGFDARRIQVRGHSSFEAYSNEQNRWIICDASYNRTCHLFADADGNFLGCADLIRRHEALEWNPRALSDVRMMVCREEEFVPVAEQFPSMVAQACAPYTHLGISTRKTEEYGKRASTPRGRTLMAWYFRECERAWFREDGMDCGPNNILVDNLAHLCPSRNRVKLSLVWQRRERRFRISLQPVGVTIFDAFLVSVDGESPRLVQGEFMWRLHPGVNVLSVRTRNKLGAVGYPSRIVIWRSP